MRDLQQHIKIEQSIPFTTSETYISRYEGLKYKYSKDKSKERDYSSFNEDKDDKKLSEEQKQEKKEFKIIQESVEKLDEKVWTIYFSIIAYWEVF